MKIETQLAHLGKDPATDKMVVNTPVYRSSTIVFPDFDTCEAANLGRHSGFTYSRHGNPSTLALEEALAGLDGSNHVLVFSSGLAAVTASLLAFLESGDHVLIPDNVYGSTRKMCEHLLVKMGVEVEFYNPVLGADIEKCMRKNTRVIYTESPGSMTLEMQDVPALAAIAHAHNAVLLADNTWATPLHFKPFEKGVDVSIHSTTKYVSGHSDLIMGHITTQSKDHYLKIKKIFDVTGPAPAPDNCFLALRGLRTMQLRVNQQMENALKVAQWLESQEEVERVLYPPLPSDAGHGLWKRDFSGGASVFTAVLKATGRDAIAQMVNGLTLFKMGYSWGGYESLIVPFRAEKIRTVTQWKHEGWCVRMHVGLEHPDDLIADLAEGFKRMK